ncbi:putative RNA-binding protein 18 [Cichlidogyrus casuarinus]|uniref:RNA-binding protein 18 n=1 Tax=Cichlidogyrus casuarinus TaxID=1844966 RepID=A0ABD2Q242_9PLAT
MGETRIWIANLPHRITEYALVNVLKQFGSIEDLFLPFNKTDGKSLGYCIVKFKSADSASAARNSLNKKKVFGRRLLAQNAKEKQNQEPEKLIRPSIELQPKNSTKKLALKASSTIRKVEAALDAINSGSSTSSSITATSILAQINNNNRKNGKRKTLSRL